MAAVAPPVLVPQPFVETAVCTTALAIARMCPTADVAMVVMSQALEVVRDAAVRDVVSGALHGVDAALEGTGDPESAPRDVWCFPRWRCRSRW